MFPGFQLWCMQFLPSGKPSSLPSRPVRPPTPHSYLALFVRKLLFLCYELNVYVPPNFYVATLSPIQCDGIRRWDFGEVIKTGGGHERGAPANRISALIRVTEDLASSLLSIKHRL